MITGFWVENFNIDCGGSAYFGNTNSNNNLYMVDIRMRVSMDRLEYGAYSGFANNFGHQIFEYVLKESYELTVEDIKNAFPEALV